MNIQDHVSKKDVVDTGSRIIYSIFVGIIIDYFWGGLTGWGIVGSRTTATGINSLTSVPYGRWQDKWYKVLKTTPEKRTLKEIFNQKDITKYFEKEKSKEVITYSGRRGKQFLTDMLAFNTFEPIVYGISNCAGQLVKHNFDIQEIDLNVTYEGMKTLMYFSPFVAPTLRWTMQGARKLFGIKTSAEMAEENLENILKDDNQYKVK